MLVSDTVSPVHQPIVARPSNRSSGEVKPYRVLVVDDEDSVRASIARFLKSRGYEAVTEDSGAAALARLSPEHFDIMLCDIRMPSLSGLAGCSHPLPPATDPPLL